MPTATIHAYTSNICRFVSLSLVATLCLSGCDQAADSGGVGASPKAPQDLERQASAEASAACGTDGGPKCALDTPCDPKGQGCQVASFGSLKCQTFAEDCSALQVPVCDASVLSCGTKKDILVCECGGKIVPRDCAIQNSRIAPDPTWCSRETFPCGSTTCREGLEVCVTSKESGGSPHCQSAAERGCSVFGIADCMCLDKGDTEECAFVTGGVEIRDRVEREDNPNNVFPADEAEEIR